MGFILKSPLLHSAFPPRLGCEERAADVLDVVFCGTREQEAGWALCCWVTASGHVNVWKKRQCFLHERTKMWLHARRRVNLKQLLQQAPGFPGYTFMETFQSLCPRGQTPLTTPWPACSPRAAWLPRGQEQNRRRVLHHAPDKSRISVDAKQRKWLKINTMKKKKTFIKINDLMTLSLLSFT